MKNILNIFNKYCTQSFAEADRRHYDYMKEVFENTELFCSFNNSLVGSKKDYSQIMKNTYISEYFRNLALPFKNQFIGMEIGEGFEKTVYPRNSLKLCLNIHIYSFRLLQWSHSRAK